MNKFISSNSFPDKLLTLCQSTKNKMWMIKLTINQLVYYQLFQKHLKRSFIHSSKLLSIKYFDKNGVDSEKGILNRTLMDLSKAYDCLSHGVLLAKHAAYGFEKCHFFSTEREIGATLVVISCWSYRTWILVDIAHKHYTSKKVFCGIRFQPNLKIQKPKFSQRIQKSNQTMESYYM